MQQAGARSVAGVCGRVDAGRSLQTAACRVNAVAAPERKLRDPREENVPGDFYVDSTCIGKPTYGHC